MNMDLLPFSDLRHAGAGLEGEEEGEMVLGYTEALGAHTIVEKDGFFGLIALRETPYHRIPNVGCGFFDLIEDETGVFEMRK